MSEQRHPGDANAGSILRSDRQRDHDLGHPSLVDCDGDALGPGEACGRGPAERACPGCGWRTRDVEREGHVCLTPAQPLTAPESDVRLTEAEREAWDVDPDLWPHTPPSGGHGLNAYDAAIERIDELAERLRVVEGERDEAWRVAAQRRDEARRYYLAWQVARMRSRSLRALQAVAGELLALKDGPRDADYERRKPLAWATLRALLAGGEER